MAIPSRQIGGSTRSNLLWQISKQLEHLICVRSCGCGGNTTTTTSSSSTTTTTSTETPITIECITYLATNGNIYAYDPVTNVSIDLFNDELNYFAVSNTNTKLWAQVSGGYIREYDLTFDPGPIPTYNRLINIGDNVLPIFAIDNLTLIAWDNTNKLVTELNITTDTAVSTTKGTIENEYNVSDAVLTTSGKLILIAINNSVINSISTRIYQYDYSTWTLEIMLDVTNQLPTFVISGTLVRSYIIGISQYQEEIYLFSRVLSCVSSPGVTSRVYNLDLLTNTLIYTGNDTGFTCTNSASSQLICNTVELSPNCQDCIEGTEITIGTQTWSGCNLNVDTYQNGDIIPEVQDPVIWASLTTGAWCHYNNDPANEAIYGKLYNWYAVNDSRGLAPSGWHVPSDDEFTTLANYLGGATYAGGKMKEEGLCHWNSPNTGATNESGFTGLPGGARIYNTGGFSYLNNLGFFWTSTEATEYFTDTAFFYWLLVGAAYLDRNYVSKVTGNSVRLIKGPAGTTTTTSSTSSTSTTTTTLAPTGFNTIYTHFESL
jgi:uncharacterized protein (TIGR02145 family)